MRRFFLVALATLLTLPTAVRADCACEACVAPIDAARELEIARLEQRLYRRVEYPARVRELKGAIDFSETRIELLRQRMREYDRITRFGTGNALTVTVERARLDLLREEQLLRSLRLELAATHRGHRERKRLHALRVQAASQAATPIAHREPRITIVNH